MVHSIPNGIPIDIHYPSSNIQLGLFRSEYTITGIGYDCRKKEFRDPLNGLSDLARRELCIHSPAYVISGPSAFPRLYRTALKLGVPLPEKVSSLIRTFAPMVSIHDGHTNMRVLYKTLKIFSHLQSFDSICNLIEHGLFQSMFPEVSPLLSTGDSLQHSVQQNLNIIRSSYKQLESTAEYAGYLAETPFLFDNVSRLGLLRFCTLFLGLGFAYYRLQPNSPYELGVANGNTPIFVPRMEKNILGFMLSRFKEHRTTVKELASVISELPSIAHGILPEYYPHNDTQNLSQQSEIVRAILNQWIASRKT